MSLESCLGTWISCVQQQPLRVGVGQVVFLQSEHQPVSQSVRVSLVLERSFPNLQIRLNTSENTIKM